MICQCLSVWKKRGKNNEHPLYLPVKLMMQKCLRRNFMETAFPYTGETPLRASYLALKHWEQHTDASFSGTEI